MKRKKVIILFSIFTVLALVGLGFELFLCKKNMNNKKIAYHKEAKMNYTTYLNDNKFYDASYLAEDYNFVASLIDYFKIDYNYNYSLSEKIDYVLTYDVTAKLEVFDSDNNTKPIDKSTYEIVPKTTISGSGEVVKLDLLNQKIDYQTYNRIVQNWKKEVSPEAKLSVFFNVRWTGNSEKFTTGISDNTSSVITIPISQKTINITKPTNISVDDNIIEKVKLPVSFIIVIGSTILFITACLVRLFLVFLKINEERDQYEREVNKILREFDRAITEAKGSFKKSPNDNYIEVNDFYELMDVHDNLNTPIIFYRDSYRRCTFAVRNDNDVYYCVLRRESE